MHANPTEALCTRCGLCCDGTLFADVELAGPAEAAHIETLGVEIDDGESRALLVQPCAALCGTRCTIYPGRPRACRTFECRLLADLGAGRVGLAAARARVTRARGTVRRLEAWLPATRGRAALPLRERVAEWLASDAVQAPTGASRRRRVVFAMRALDRFVRRHFLPDSRREPGPARRSTRTRP